MHRVRLTPENKINNLHYRYSVTPKGMNQP